MKREDYRKACARRKEIRSEMAALQAKLAKENRSMTDDEQNQFRDIKAEDDRLALECTIFEQERSTERARILAQREASVSGEVNFAHLLRSMITGHGVPEEFRSMQDADGNFAFPYSAADVQLRAATIQGNETVGPITPVYIKDYIKELEPETILGQLGLHIQSGIAGQWNYPTVKGEDCDWLPENDEVKGMNVALGVKSITPHRLPCRVDISNRAITQTGGAIRDIMVETMRTKHALRLNKTFVSATAIENAPKGPFVDIDAEHTIAATGALSTIKRDDFINLRSAVNGKSNVPVNNPAYLINWNTWAQLVNTPIDKGSGRFVLDPLSNTIDGIKVVVSNLVPDGVAYYGNFGYTLIGQFGAMTMGVDSTSVAVLSTNVTSIVINSEWDFFTPYQEAFGKLTYTTAAK